MKHKLLLTINLATTLDIKEIKQIIDLMARSELTEFEIEREGLKLRINRDHSKNTVSFPVITQGSAPIQASPPPTVSTPTVIEEDKNIKIIKSPMVGTFYAASSPDIPPFVKIGSRLSAESIICIIEAMKVMNEIQAELNGVVTEILVQNGQNIEYGQPLFKVNIG